MPRSGQRWAEIRRSLEEAERWLLPGACLLCGQTVEEPSTGGQAFGRSGGRTGVDPLICPPCLNRFSTLPHPQCERCGQPLTPGIACRLCADWPEGFGSVKSAVWLDDAVRRAVHLLKYGGWSRLADPLADVMAIRIPGLGTLSRRGLSAEHQMPSPERRVPSPVLVPIPLSPARKRARGYNQAAVLTSALARRTGVAVEDVLRRGRETGTQTALTPEERRANLAGAFTSTRPPPRHAMLVDDVFTTGATLAEAARVLLEAGAVRVTAVTFARAVRPLDPASAVSLRL